MSDDPSRIMRAYYLDQTLVGMSYVFTAKDIAYLGYLAVLPEAQNRHFGTAILKQIEQQYADYRITIDIERIMDDNDPTGIKQKRRSFYLHRGYEAPGLYYHFFHVDYEILVKNGVMTADDWKAMVAAHWGSEAVKQLVITVV